ncbi:MAG: DUF6338 family protein [Vulcanimicrobiota bacterium]
MLPNLGPLLVIFLPGFVAMEIAYFAGPRNFRSNSEVYKYVIALLLGTVIFGVTTIFAGERWGDGWSIVTDPAKISLERVFGTLLVTVLIAYLWHVCFSWILPALNQWICEQKGGAVPHFLGPVKVFDAAMAMMDGLEVEVYLKDGRLVHGRILTFPDIDGDSGLLLAVYKLGRLVDPKNWQIEWFSQTPEDVDNLLFVNSGQVEYINAAKRNVSKVSKKAGL